MWGPCGELGKRRQKGKAPSETRLVGRAAVGRGLAYCFEVAAFSMIAATVAGLDS